MIEAKDTVRTYYELKAYCEENGIALPIQPNDLKLAAAEISFKAGYKQRKDEELPYYKEERNAGIREVVEFVHAEFGGYTKAVADGGELINILIDNDYGEDGSLDKWQAKLKEWGI